MRRTTQFGQQLQLFQCPACRKMTYDGQYCSSCGYDGISSQEMQARCTDCQTRNNSWDNGSCGRCSTPEDIQNIKNWELSGRPLKLSRRFSQVQDLEGETVSVGDWVAIVGDEFVWEYSAYNLTPEGNNEAILGRVVQVPDAMGLGAILVDVPGSGAGNFKVKSEQIVHLESPADIF